MRRWMIWILLQFEKPCLLATMTRTTSTSGQLPRIRATTIWTRTTCLGNNIHRLPADACGIQDGGHISVFHRQF